ncbi:tetratricopeptide TPR_2 repeat protein [Candidatus Vecturithrix granuli]|uniref:Tetratricopeptide TPR_2 repeat protein n=1 Tax=Vecturithrix granuli TaxID=1499967 RepID=A0A081BWS2_VECG1|nr:tetratricopeptide TPR_2 repeat protein [Candidatus Vecturithrix granuli]
MRSLSEVEGNSERLVSTSLNERASLTIEPLPNYQFFSFLLLTPYPLLQKTMKFNPKYIIFLVQCMMAILLFSAAGFSQETTPESLRLPEVVITGIEQLKIQRELPKVTPEMSLPVITQSARDRSDKVLQEADRLALTQPQQAAHQYLQAILLDPLNSLAYLRLGDAYQASSQYDMAVAAYQKALSESPQLAQAHYQLGMLFERYVKDPQKAIEHYRTYLELGGMDKRVQIWLRNLEKNEE